MCAGGMWYGGNRGDVHVQVVSVPPVLLSLYVNTRSWSQPFYIFPRQPRCRRANNGHAPRYSIKSDRKAFFPVEDIYDENISSYLCGEVYGDRKKDDPKINVFSDTDISYFGEFYGLFLFVLGALACVCMI